MIALPQRQTITRMLLFGLGGLFSYGLNVGAFLLLRKKLGLTEEVAYAISLGCVTGATFTWGYFVNFRTNRPLHDCASRYVLVQACCFGLNYAIAQTGFNLFPERPKLVILATLVFIAALKFGAYHFWVFPAHSAVPCKDDDIRK
jgi:putative flippase GtrA